jgi:hypothetical protein
MDYHEIFLPAPANILVDIGTSWDCECRLWPNSEIRSCILILFCWLLVGDCTIS